MRKKMTKKVNGKNVQKPEQFAEIDILIALKNLKTWLMTFIIIIRETSIKIRRHHFSDW